MNTPFYRRFLQDSGLAGAARLTPAKMSEVAAQIQRGLAKLGGEAGQALDPAKGLGEAMSALRGFKLPGLDAGRRSPPPSGKAMESRDFASAAGNRPYKLFVPAGLQAGAPLLVMLHGCTQTAEDFAAGTRMNALAGRRGVAVLYPEQVRGANAQRCWNWFNPADQQRGHGEAAIIADMTRAVVAEFKIDPKRVFVAGLSAGGAHAAVLGAAYPEVFAAIGVHSGLACGSAHDMTSAFTAMQQGRPGQGRLAVPAITFHGDRDTTVNPRNADEVAAQLAAEGREHVEKGIAPGGLAFTRKIRLGAEGKPMLEQWSVHGAGHAWSGGSSDGSYTEPRGPDASAEMVRFFLSL